MADIRDWFILADTLADFLFSLYLIKEMLYSSSIKLILCQQEALL